MKKSILFADDDEVFRFTIGEYFEMHPFLTFDFAENGVIALDKALSKKYDLILMDINMPFMKGNEAVKIIKSKWPNICVLAFTAMASSDQEKGFIADGFNGVIAKPVEIKFLESKIAEYLTGIEKPPEVKPPEPLPPKPAPPPKPEPPKPEPPKLDPTAPLMARIKQLEKEKQDLGQIVVQLRAKIKELEIRITSPAAHPTPSVPASKPKKEDGVPEFEID